MKKYAFLLVAFLFTTITVISAQDAGAFRKTADNRIKATMEKMEKLQLSATVKPQVEVVVKDFFDAQYSYLMEVRASGTIDREAVKAKHMQLITDRDNKLTTLLTAEQYKMWKEELEPALRPQNRGN